MNWEEKQTAFQTELMVAKDAIWQLQARVINLETEVKTLRAIITETTTVTNRKQERRKKSRTSSSSSKTKSDEQFRKNIEEDAHSSDESFSIKIERHISSSGEESGEEGDAYLNDDETDTKSSLRSLSFETETLSSLEKNPLHGSFDQPLPRNETRKRRLKHKGQKDEDHKHDLTSDLDLDEDTKPTKKRKSDPDWNTTLVKKSKEILASDKKIEPLRVKTRKSYELRQKIEIINSIKAGKSQRDVADESGMSRGSVGHIWRDREKLEAHFSTGRINIKKNRKSKYVEIDNELYKWFCENKGSSPDGGTLKAQALQLAPTLGFPNFTASNGWFDGWKSRFNLRFKKHDKQSLPFSENDSSVI